MQLWLSSAPGRTVLIGLGYFILASLTIATTRLGGGLASLWVASALMTAALLSFPAERRRAVIVACGTGSLFATSLFGFGILAAFPLAAFNMLESVIAAALFRRMMNQSSPLDSVKGFAAFALVAGLIAPAVTSSGGAALAAMHGQDLAQSVVRWVTGHGLGALAFTPLFLLLLTDEMRQWRKAATWRTVAEAAALLGLVAALSALVFWQSRAPLLFLPLLPVLVATFRFGRFGAATSVMLVALIGGSATSAGLGPVMLLDASRDWQLHFFQLFLAVTVLCSVPAAAELSKRKQLFLQLAESEARYRLLADGSTDIIMSLSCGGRIRAASQSISSLAGYRAEEVIGKHAFDFIDPSDVDAVQAVHQRALAAPGETQVAEYRALLADGRRMWMETQTQAICGEDGRPSGTVSVLRNIEHRKARERELVRQADTDGLTGALNRRAFMRTLETALQSKRQAEQGCLACFDLDFFKQVNDRHGHQTGDEVLRAFAQLVLRSLREGDAFGRLGGEEFGLFLRGASRSDAIAVCDRIRAAVAGLRIELGHDRYLQVTVSAGVAAFAAGGSAEAWLHSADLALYRAKAAGRNRLELAA